MLGIVAGFEAPDWDAPIDVELHLEGVPEHAQMRGLFMDAIVRRARTKGAQLGRERYLPFRFYPLREHLEVLVAGARILHPEASLRRALYQLSRLALPTFQKSTVGRVLSSLAPLHSRAGLGLLARSYQATRNVGSARVGAVTAESAIFELRDVHDFPDCVHLGIIEWALIDAGLSGRVRVRRLSPFDVDLEVPIARR